MGFRINSGDSNIHNVKPEGFNHGNKENIPPQSVPPPSEKAGKDLKNTAAFLNKIPQQLRQHIATKKTGKVSGNVEIDKEFLCNDKDFQAMASHIGKMMDQTNKFDLQSFQIGLKNPENDATLAELSNSFAALANALVKDKQLSLPLIYKLLVGALDRFDENELKSPPPRSTFVLRTALLLSAQEEGGELESWCVYTKGGKPQKKGLWDFLDNWKNWVPEAQGIMAKHIEVSLVKALELAKGHTEQKVVLLKGGFGAGKTRLASHLYQEKSVGVIAPDKSKEVVRRSLPKVPHHAAHVQGSELAYKLHAELIEKLAGTVVYDSSLSNPKDLENYIEKSNRAGKQVVVYDIYRHDLARALAVLKRRVSGEDPRIPPDYVISSSIQDKLSRLECINVVRKTKSADGKPPEYHLYIADEKGWDTQEALVIRGDKIEATGHVNRLPLAGLEYNSESSMLTMNVDEKDLKKHFAKEFERPVHEIMNELSDEEQKALLEEFSKRVLPIDAAKKIVDLDSFISAIDPAFYMYASKAEIKSAFNGLSEEALKKFLKNIKTPLTYLDLPLRVALVINQKLKIDPWNP